VKRGGVFDAWLDPVAGSGQGGRRPVVIVSRDAISAGSPTVLVAPCTTLRPGRRLYPSHVVVRAPEGGLSLDSVILAEQTRVLGKSRLLARRGSLSPETLLQLARAFRITLDLD
jgi:mRNA interferase MazF